MDFLKLLILNKYFIITCVALVGYLSTFELGNDNPVEEIAEEALKDMTGLDIDLTPKKKKRTE